MSGLRIALSHFPSHKLDNSFILNSRSRIPRNVLTVHLGICQLPHVSSQLNNSVRLVIWIFHGASHRNQSDGSDGRTESTILQSQIDLQVNWTCYQSDGVVIRQILRLWSLLLPQPLSGSIEQLTGKWQKLSISSFSWLVVYSIYIDIFLTWNSEFQSVWYSYHLRQCFRKYVLICSEVTGSKILRNASKYIHNIKRSHTPGDSRLRIMFGVFIFATLCQ